MNEPINEQDSALEIWKESRFPALIGASLIGCALVGFLLGITEQQEHIRSHWKEPPAPNRLSDGPDAIPLVVSYSEIATAKIKKNQKKPLHFSQLKQQKPGMFDPVIKAPEMKMMAIVDRGKNRAFEGAPPTIPHQIDDVRAEKCLVCHSEGIQIGKRVASKMSHPRFATCVQCHVAGQGNGPFELPPLNSDNQFAGIVRSGPGVRAHPTAPPAIPHMTFMRENCMSCHGLLTRPGLRTTHPWLTNCVQCHASSAMLDQHSFVKLHRFGNQNRDQNKRASKLKP